MGEYINTNEKKNVLDFAPSTGNLAVTNLVPSQKQN